MILLSRLSSEVSCVSRKYKYSAREIVNVYKFRIINENSTKIQLE